MYTYFFYDCIPIKRSIVTYHDDDDQDKIFKFKMLSQCTCLSNRNLRSRKTYKKTNLKSVLEIKYTLYHTLL